MQKTKLIYGGKLFNSLRCHEYLTTSATIHCTTDMII